MKHIWSILGPFFFQIKFSGKRYICGLTFTNMYKNVITLYENVIKINAFHKNVTRKKYFI